MMKYRIVKRITYEDEWYEIQKKVLWWWKTLDEVLIGDIDFAVWNILRFKTIKQAEKHIEKLKFKDKRKIVR